MLFQLMHEILFQRLGIASNTKRAIIEVPACPAGNLSQFGGRPIAELLAVKLPHTGKRNMVHIQVQAHPDGIGCDQKVDVA